MAMTLSIPVDLIQYKITEYRKLSSELFVLQRQMPEPEDRTVHTLMNRIDARIAELELLLIKKR